MLYPARAVVPVLLRRLTQEGCLSLRVQGQPREYCETLSPSPPKKMLSPAKLSSRNEELKPFSDKQKLRNSSALDWTYKKCLIHLEAKGQPLLNKNVQKCKTHWQSTYTNEKKKRITPHHYGKPPNHKVKNKRRRKE